MKLSLPGALVALLAPGCATSEVGDPPPPPAFTPGASHAEARAPETTASKSDARPPAAEAGPGAQAPATAADPAATASNPAPSARASEPAKLPPREELPLGWIAGEPLEAEELLLEWGDIASRELYLVIDKLVAARLALAEASRLGIRLAPEAVVQRVAAEREKLEQQVTRDGKTRTLEEFIERELGFEPKRYLDRVRRATIRQMLAERAVRAGSLASETVGLRLIVAADEAAVEAVRAALAEGRAFAEVAAELSIDESKQDGGLVPFVVPQERSPLARLAFQTPVGEVAGPLPISDHQFWIRVEERRAPVEGDWSVVESPVEASLARYPVDDAEFVHWKLAMEKRYPIDLGPLWSLIGAAR